MKNGIKIGIGLIGVIVIGLCIIIIHDHTTKNNIVHVSEVTNFVEQINDNVQLGQDYLTKILQIDENEFYEIETYKIENEASKIRSQIIENSLLLQAIYVKIKNDKTLFSNKKVYDSVFDFYNKYTEYESFLFNVDEAKNLMSYKQTLIGMCDDLDKLWSIASYECIKIDQKTGGIEI